MNRFKIKDFGTCLNLTPSTSVVNFGTTSNLALAGDVSFSFWVNLNTRHFNGGTRKYIIRKDRPFILNFNPNGTLEFAIHNGSSYQALSTAKNTWEAGVWYHVVCVSSTVNGRKIYINGVLDASNASALTPVPTAANFLIGAEDTTGLNRGDCLIDEVRVYAQELTAAEVVNLYYNLSEPSNTNLRLYAKFDEGSGSSVTDSSGGANTGAITGATYSTNVVMKPRIAV